LHCLPATIPPAYLPGLSSCVSLLAAAVVATTASGSAALPGADAVVFWSHSGDVRAAFSGVSVLVATDIATLALVDI